MYRIVPECVDVVRTVALVLLESRLRSHCLLPSSAAEMDHGVGWSATAMLSRVKTVAPWRRLLRFPSVVEAV